MANAVVVESVGSFTQLYGLDNVTASVLSASASQGVLAVPLD